MKIDVIGSLYIQRYAKLDTFLDTFLCSILFNGESVLHFLE